MVSFRSGAIALLVAAASAAVAGPSAASPLATTTLSGFVRDAAGSALPGVEILVLAPEGHSDGALLRAVSDAGGRFLLGAIPPGVYRVAAIKSGYIAALGRVNTVLRSSVELVLRPVPKDGEPGSEKVLDDLSWTLRVPTKSILRELDESALLASASGAATGSHVGGARAFAARVQDAVRGEVDHVVALGSFRPGTSGPSSNLEGNETRMRVGGAIGERGAIQVRGRRGSLGSASSNASLGAVSRGASAVDLDLTYDTAADENLAMRAFYSSGNLEVTDPAGVAGVATRQSQRSWGYDAKWRKQVDASSRVALQVGFHDANLDVDHGAADGLISTSGDAASRAIGAEGSYENLVGEGHLVHVGVRAQRLSLSAPGTRLGRENGLFSLDGASGFSLLVDSGDRWSISGPIAVTYGLALTQGFDGRPTTTVAPRVGGSWTAGRIEATAEVSYFATAGTPADPSGPQRSGIPSPYGYDVGLKSHLDPSLTLRGSATYLPSRATAVAGRELPQGAELLYVSDGFVSDRFVAIELERVAPSATVSFRVARGHVEGVLAPALDEVPVVLLADRELNYDAARFGLSVPRAGSVVALEYRSVRDHEGSGSVDATGAVKTVALDFAQDLVRFAGGRASCRLLLTARSALGPASVASDAGSVDARQIVADHRRLGAGVSLAF
jgi:hypothetical protein